MSSYQLKEVAQIWFTQSSVNRSVDVGPIELEDFKKAFFGKYFPSEKREVKIKEL